MTKRGTGPLVSILLPTRKRPQWLCESLDSLYSLAKDKSLLEFILKVDDDDVETIDVVAKLSTIMPIKTLITPRGRGYHEMHHWVNEMSAISKGDWIFIFNDDARMQTPEWDQILLNAEIEVWHGLDEICLYVATTQQRATAYEFVILRREVYNILGHFSLSPHNDHWICAIMSLISSAHLIPLYINHFSAEATDDTRKESEFAYSQTQNTFNSLPAIRNKVADASKILDYIAAKKPELSIVTS